MKTVSRQYKQAMAKEFRNRSHCIVTFGNTDISAITDGTWSGDASTISSFDTLDYEHAYTEAIATLELNRWALDGRSSVKRENDGYIANQYGEQHLIKEFTSPHNFSGMTLYFDSRENTWPFAVRLDYYGTETEVPISDENGTNFVTENNDTIDALCQSSVTSKTVYPTSTTCEIVLSGIAVNKISLTFISTLPHTRARVESVSWGVAAVFDDSKLVSVKQTHDVDPISRRLPNERLTFVITDFEHQYDPDNPQGVYSTINKGAPVSVSYGYEVEEGVTEWLKSDRYSLINDPVFKDNKVTFNCVGLIQTLTGYYYKGVYNSSGASLYSLATSVLTDAGLPLTPAGENPWEIDNTLNSMMTTAVLPVDTHANLLQLIAHAARCRLSTDDSNVIHMKPFGVTPTGIFDGVYSDSGHTDYSEWNSVDYGSSELQSIATLELNRWCLDGTSNITRRKTGYVSDTSSSYIGTSSSYWKKEFDVSHDLPVLTLMFDTVEDTWPFKITVEYYGDSGLITSKTVYPNDVTTSVTAESVTDCTWIKVIESATLPYTRSRINKVSFKETDFSLTLDDINHKTESTTKIENLRNVYVSEYSYTPGETTTIFEDDTTLESMHLEFAASTDISVTVTGGSVISQNVYSQAIDLNMSAGTKHVVITGKPIEQSEQVHTQAVNQTGDDDVEQNMLITNNSMATALSNHMKSYLVLRNTYDASYRGNPELEVGDIIELETPYTKIVYGLMLTDEITYNGALHGKVKVKGLT